MELTEIEFIECTLHRVKVDLTESEINQMRRDGTLNAELAKYSSDAGKVETGYMLIGVK